MAQSNHFKQILNTIYMYNIYNNIVLEMCNSNSIVAVLIRRPWTGIFFLPIYNFNYYNLPVTDTMFASGLNDSVKSESSFAIAYQTNYKRLN